jgi:hypothetical protein
MPLAVRPIEQADVAQCIALRVASLGSLVIGRPPPYPGYVQEAEASVRNDLDNRPFVHHLKVVDPENEGEVMAYGKWEVYPHGRSDLEKLSQPMDQADKEVDQYGLLREAAHEYFCTRNGEKGKHPHLRKLAHTLLSHFTDSEMLTIHSPCTSGHSQAAQETGRGKPHREMGH